ncbi:hypothetical protein [Actinomadura chibensis]|uniref:Uncharacterized protein n=1 Tax=Actinomadura chibensis TaxID=392828 RepID=A0A5D0N1Z8_9ACTN|nr:hypothetical protein [Actinomadura chibensis]TYB38372.1 hypothetical protein FXF69_41255 [Actinomadura chibensis]
MAGASAVIAGGAFAVVGTAADAGTAGRTNQRVAATTLWAKVAANGALLDASGIGGVTHSPGRYNLTTSVDIIRCALIGTINTNGGDDPGPGSASILVGALNRHTLFVRTATPSAPGNPKIVDDDRPFSVTVTC